MTEDMYIEEQKETTYVLNGVEIKESEMPTEFKEGDIFTGSYNPGAAIWCNNSGNHYISEIEKAEDGTRRFQVMRVPEPEFHEVISNLIRRVDSHTSATILAGFDYEVAGEVLHFSYDSFDQQNFADTANVATLSLTGVEGLPTSIVWNAYRNYTKETGGELVRITLSASEFLELYTNGALVFKQTTMEVGSKRKEILNTCTTKEEAEAYMVEWDM